MKLGDGGLTLSRPCARKATEAGLSDGRFGRALPRNSSNGFVGDVLGRLGSVDEEATGPNGSCRLNDNDGGGGALLLRVFFF